MLPWLRRRLWKRSWYRAAARKIAAHFGRDLYEHPMLAKHRSFVHSTLVAFLLSWGALVIGVWTALDQDHLEQSTRLGACMVRSMATTPIRDWNASPGRAPASVGCDELMEKESLRLAPSRSGVRPASRRLTRRAVRWDWDVVFFWIALLVLTGALWARLRADDRKQDDRALDLLHAVHRSPDLNVVRYYPGWLYACESALFDDWPDATLPAARQREVIAGSIRSIIWIIGGLARQFARAGESRYGANVMVYLRNDLDNPHHFVPPILGSLRFHDASAVAGFEALLYLPGELLVADIDLAERQTMPLADHGEPPVAAGTVSSPGGSRARGGATSATPSATAATDVGFGGADARHIPLISLAVLQRNSATDEYDLVLPGAPAAVVHEDVCGLSVHHDTRTIAEDCTSFDSRVRERIADYFSPNGEGQDIRSFASWRIGPRDTPLGVLNVDSDTTYVLGIDPVYYVTFSALVTPMLSLLEGALSRYRELLADDLGLPPAALEWEPAAAATLAETVS